MESIVDIAIRSEHQAFWRGAEAGFWKGFGEGAQQQRIFIIGESEVNPYDMVPDEYQPLGAHYFPYTFLDPAER